MASHAHNQYDPNEYPTNVGKPHTKVIWKTFFILCGITAVEFAFAFMMDAGTLRTAIFIILTIFKAFYIVAEFMHLKHEVKGLIWAIIVPMAFVVWLVVALINEGAYIYDSIINYLQ